MTKLDINTALLFFFIFQAVYTLKIHQFYALEKTDVVSTSQSIKSMEKCKNDCLTMGTFFPFKFKYHRYVLRQTIGSNKYFQGTCHFSLPNTDKWYDWDYLKVFITQTSTLVDMSQMQRWSYFRDSCQDKTLKLDESALKSLGFQRVHSNFQYYDDGNFVNLQPFTDLNDMLSQVSGIIH